MVRDLWQRAAENPIKLLDWAAKVGVASAIGLYLVIKIVAVMTVLVDAMVKQGTANTAALQDIQRATTEIAGATRTLENTNRIIISAGKEQASLSVAIQDAAKAAHQASVAAQTAAGVAETETKETNTILRRSMEAQAVAAAGILGFQGKVAGEHKSMLDSQTAVMKNQLKALENHGKIMEAETLVLKNQGSILNYLKPPPGKSEGNK